MRIQAVLLAVLLMACGDGGGPDEDAFVARFEASFGQCYGICYYRLDVASDGSAEVAYAERKGARESKQTFLLRQSELDGLLEDAALARTETWAPVYGCPDCVDQGRYSLKLADKGEVREAMVDPMFMPAHLSPMILRLTGVLVRSLR
ncbi:MULTISPECIES: hypothetical protein [Myxococcus]|uniref:Lipoprotein n=1 Tax=Myxococcus xanthus TaxID=34 RepID=A0A7Y4MPI8_MYXXA|nr:MULTISPECIES: hypothetical protein [Myxococcus]NOJ77921.1 hypothetical protein [Myxococcus xanthus]NOJ86168.1 hypothetical protein [Myxococcus xanthus]